MDALEKKNLILRAAVMFAVIAVILLLHWYFVVHGVYISVWWSDIFLHLAGSIWLAVLFMYYRRSFVGVLLFVLLIGSIWEAMEFFIDVPFFGVGKRSFSDPIWQLNTLSDLAVDSIGAIIAFILRRRRI